MTGALPRARWYSVFAITTRLGTRPSMAVFVWPVLLRERAPPTHKWCRCEPGTSRVLIGVHVFRSFFFVRARQTLESTGDLGLQLNGLPRRLDAAGVEAGGAEASEKARSTVSSFSALGLSGCCFLDDGADGWNHDATAAPLMGDFVGGLSVLLLSAPARGAAYIFDGLSK